MNTTTKTAPARPALKLRTTVKAGVLCTNENFIEASFREVRARVAGFLGENMDGTGI